MAGDLTVRNIKVTDRIEPGSAGGTVTLGNSINADTIAVPSGVTLNINSGATFSATAGTMSGQNYPAFEAYLSSSQTISDNTATKIQFDTEVFDTDSFYDNATNYRFTPTMAGKYFFYSFVAFETVGADNILTSQLFFYKNGTIYSNPNTITSSATFRRFMMNLTCTIDMNGSSDYVEVFGLLDTSSATPEFNAGTQQSIFGAYRIGD